MKFSKKKFNRRNKKKTIKKNKIKKNKSRTKPKVKRSKLTKRKFYKFKGGNPELDDLFTKIINYIQEDNIDNIKTILESKPALINYEIEDGNIKSTLLQQAILLNKPDIIRLLVEKGANVNMISGKRRPLGYATFSNCFECVKILVENGANINGKDILGKTALMYSLAKRINLDKESNEVFLNEEIIKYLLNNGANIEQKDDYGWTALFYSIEYGVPSIIIKLLLDKGANLKNLSSINNTPLQIACKRRNLEIIKLLFDYGAKNSINYQDIAGKTALIIASIENKDDIVNFLLENDADPSIKDNDGFTALKYAKEYGIKLDKELMNPKKDSSITYLAKQKEKNMIIINLLEEKIKAQIKAKLGQKGQQNNQNEIKKLQEEAQNLEKQITANTEIMNKIKESNADIIAQQLIEEDENQKRKDDSKKNKKAKAKAKAKEKAKAKDLTNDKSENVLIHETEKLSTMDDSPNISTEQKTAEISENQYDPEYIKQLHEEANQRFDSDTQKAIDLSMELLNIQKEKDKEKELLHFWSQYFGKNQESLLELKKSIPSLISEQNSYQLLVTIIPAYSNKFINKNPYLNNVLSLLFLLIGIISNQINKNENQVYIILKGGAAIQTVSSQLANQSYESNDLDIIIINNKNLDNISKVNENKMLVEKIGELLKWLTSVEENNQIKYILSFDSNEDETYQIYKIKIGNNSLMDLDYNILPSEILPLYKNDIYNKNFTIEPYGNFNGTFFCPSLINLIKEKMYYLITYGSIGNMKIDKNRAFFNYKIPKSLNYLLKVYKIMGDFKDNQRDFYERIFSYFFRDYPNLEKKLTDPDDPALKRNDETLVPYTKPLLIKFLIEKINKS